MRIGRITWMAWILAGLGGVAEAGWFSAPVTAVPNLTLAWGKALGDINGDGVLDVVILHDNGGGGRLAWHEGSPGGAMGWQEQLIAAAAPNGSPFACGDLEVADFDGDGDLDVFGPAHPGEWANAGATTHMYWYENPSWTAHAIGEAPDFIKDVSLADFNRDGRMDVAVLCFESTSLTIFRQDSAAAWTEVASITLSGLHEGMDAGDLDGDGDPDLSACGYWFENPGGDLTGTWTSRVIDPKWNNQTGGWQRNATKTVCADFDGDGRDEVAISHSESDGYPVAWYDAADPVNGTWTEHVIRSGMGKVHTLQAGDLDLDGRLDVVAGENAGQSQYEVRAFINLGAGQSWREETIDDLGAYNGLLGDADGDGDLDLWRLRSHTSTELEVLLKNNWIRHLVDDSFPQVSLQIEAGDLDGDGDLDIASGAHWWANTAGTWVRNDFGGSLNQFAILFDADGDGDPDVLGTEGLGTAANHAFRYARNDGGGTFSVRSIGSLPDGDFLQGVAAAELVPGTTQVLLSWHANGTGLHQFTLPADPWAAAWPSGVFSPVTQKEDLSVGDIDGDGDPDVCLGTIWLEQTPEGWSQRVVGVVSDLPGIGGAPEPDRNDLADLDGDGDLDIVIGLEFGTDVVAFENPRPGGDVRGAWPRHRIGVSPGQGFSMDTADVDGDGAPDVVVGEHRGNLQTPAVNRVLLFTNPGAWSNWPVIEIDAGDPAEIDHHDGTQWVDLDQDGDLDLLSIGYNNRAVWWFENQTPGPGDAVVTVSEDVDEGVACFRIDTPAATYWFDRAGGGLTSLVDPDGNDWIGWNSAAGSAGEYRGFPNTGVFHPGYTGGTATNLTPLDTPSASAVIVAERNGWGATWTFHPAHVRVELHAPASPAAYWVLFEGNPGGQVDGGDLLMLSNGRTYSANQDHPWGAGQSPPDQFEDIVNTSGAATGSEWMVLSASEMERSLYVAQDDDGLEDDYWQMNDQMTVFGFGRTDGSAPLMTRTNTAVVLGLVESRDPESIEATLDGAWNGTLSGQAVAQPVLSPPGGTYTGSVSVALLCPTPGAEIRYSLDGTPVTAGSPLYTGPVDIAGNLTLTARGYREGWLPSPPVSGVYVVEDDVLPPEPLDATSSGIDGGVEVSFDEPVDPATAEAPTNYVLEGAGQVSGAVRLGDGRTVLLTVTGLVAGQSYEITVQGVGDLADPPNVMTQAVTLVFVHNPADLRGHWPLDHESGATALDASGQEAHGLVSGASWEALGKIDGAAGFDGVDDYIDISAVQLSGSNLTLAAWIRADRFDHLASRDGRILSRANGVQEPDHEWMLSTLLVGSDTRLRLRLKAGGATTTLIASSGSVSAGQWVHVAATYDGTTLRLFQDGVEVGSAPKTGEISNSPAIPAWIGGNPSGAGDRPFDGRIDDVRIFGAALSAAELQTLMSRTNANQRPMVSVVRPVDGAVFSSAEPLRLEGSALDPEEGPVPGAQAFWSLPGSGWSATGLVATATGLTPGSHAARFTATDRHGLAATSSVNVIVLADQDGDGMPDAWEISHELPEAIPADPGLDSDGDGVADVAEWGAGTNPTNPASYLHIHVWSAVGNGMLEAGWPTVTGRQYRLHDSGGPVGGSVPGTGSDVSGSGSGGADTGAFWIEVNR